MSPVKIMQMAGHSSLATTQRYIDLAGVVFSDEVGLLGDWYRSGTKNRYQVTSGEADSRLAGGV